MAFLYLFDFIKLAKS